MFIFDYLTSFEHYSKYSLLGTFHFLKNEKKKKKKKTQEGSEGPNSLTLVSLSLAYSKTMVSLHMTGWRFKNYVIQALGGM